jgi:hypothetical protein
LNRLNRLLRLNDATRIMPAPCPTPLVGSLSSWVHCRRGFIVDVIDRDRVRIAAALVSEFRTVDPATTAGRTTSARRTFNLERAYTDLMGQRRPLPACTAAPAATGLRRSR